MTNAYHLKLYTFWDALMRRRMDGAPVRVITRVYSGIDIRKLRSLN